MNLFILRGVPGSGKSTVASIMSGGDSSIVCTADDYHINEQGVYDWKPENGHKAHTQCFQKAEKLMKEGAPLVIIANTNTKHSDFKNYENCAETYGYKVHHLIVENRHGGQNQHDVPDAVLKNMEKNILNSIRLI